MRKAVIESLQDGIKLPAEDENAIQLELEKLSCRGCSSFEEYKHKKKAGGKNLFQYPAIHAELLCDTLLQGD